MKHDSLTAKFVLSAHGGTAPYGEPRIEALYNVLNHLRNGARPTLSTVEVTCQIGWMRPARCVRQENIRSSVFVYFTNQQHDQRFFALGCCGYE